MMTSSRSSLPFMMFWMRLRVEETRASTGVPLIGKKRIKCSGGGSTVMSLIRSSSVMLVRSALAVIADFLLQVVQKNEGIKKPPGRPAVRGIRYAL